MNQENYRLLPGNVEASPDYSPADLVPHPQESYYLLSEDQLQRLAQPAAPVVVPPHNNLGLFFGCTAAVLVSAGFGIYAIIKQPPTVEKTVVVPSPVPQNNYCIAFCK